MRPESRGAPKVGAGRAIALLTAALVVVLVPGVASAQSAGIDEGVLVRVAGNAAVAPGEQVATVVVVNGNLTMEGTADVVVVVDGAATFKNATVDTLVVVAGTVDLMDGTVVTGDAWIPESELEMDAGSRVDGDIVDDASGYARAFFVFGILFAIGLGILSILSALVLAAVAPSTMRRATTAIRDEFPQVLVSGVVFWVAIPLAAVLLLVTVVGTPTALAIWGFVLPMIGFVGYLVVAVLVGEALVKDQADSHPYKSAALGALVLGALWMIPVVGALIGTVAALLGGSALILLGWKTLRSKGTDSLRVDESPLTLREGTAND